MMSEEATIDVLKERCLQDMPYEILFEIFRSLPKGRLCEITKLCSKFRGAAGDKRLWKNVRIKYAAYMKPTWKIFAFEDLYSEPWPVKLVDLSETKICPPVTSHIDQVIKVAKLDLSSITADEVAMTAILNKYQCRELYLGYPSILQYPGTSLFPYIKIAPEVFSKQTALEVLSLGRIKRSSLNSFVTKISGKINEIDQWLIAVLRNCKNLKTLDLRYLKLSGFDNPGMLNFIENLPASLEKLLLTGCQPEDYFFQLLAESTPKLKELELDSSKVGCRSLLKFQFLEALHVIRDGYEGISDLHTYLIKFPALKTVSIGLYYYDAIMKNSVNRNIQMFEAILQPHGITVGSTIYPEWPPHTEDGDLWNVL